MAGKKAEKPKEKKTAIKKPKKEAEEKLGKEIGRVTHYFDHLSVAVVEISSSLKVGDKIRIKGATTDFEQKIDSMQIEHESVQKAKKGDAIGLKVSEKARPNDMVYLAK